MLSTMKPFLQQVWQSSSFLSPTTIQEKAIPFILEGSDGVFESPTGTGKTVSYLLPLLQRIDPSQKSTQVLVLAPTRELVMQIHQEVQKWTKDSGIISAAFIGDINIKKQVEKLRLHPQFIVATPGRVLELIKLKKLKMHEVKAIVVDEIDLLIEQKLISNVKEIVKTTQKDRQLLFFSATISENTVQFAKEIMKEHEIIRVQRMEQDSNVEHLYFVADHREKIDLLRRLLHTGTFKALAFINDHDRIAQVEAKLNYKGVQLRALHGESTKIERQQALKDFRAGKFPLLVATDVAARGLDIEGLTHVIHFDFPQDAKQYIHRSGRTGRMGSKGTVISIVTPREESMLKRLGVQLGIDLKKKALFKGDIINER
ncbi:DEAD/DEAH box helicase [Tepidibacillus marianensis]|uniref:DEAD/DEAH box helicase n=1 Tax=Tepidibacillus marianensis TaxID=3131995 RepID=UPI00386F4454